MTISNLKLLGEAGYLLVILFLIYGCKNTINEQQGNTADMPDPVLFTDHLDLNEDLILDYRFGVEILETHEDPSSTMSFLIYVQPEADNQNSYYIAEDTERRLELTPGTWIDEDSLQWDNSNQLLTRLNYNQAYGWDDEWEGEWAFDPAGYLGVKFEIDNQLHFGWISLQIDAISGDLLINDYQYNPVPDSAIKAGMEP